MPFMDIHELDNEYLDAASSVNGLWLAATKTKQQEGE